jgi:hypothetical protein
VIPLTLLLVHGKSSAGKLEAAQHHNRIIKRKGRKMRIERGFFLCILFLEILSAFYRHDPT